MNRRLWTFLAIGATVTAAVVVVGVSLTRGSSSPSTPIRVAGHAALVDAQGVAVEGLDAVQQDIAAGALVLDVRKDDEWSAGRVAGSMHIPLTEVQDRTAELPKGRTIVTVCKDGGRSYKAAYALRQAGYDAVNLDGGLTAWAAAGLPLVDNTGAPGHIG